jgi:phage baseplate assembly protein W
MATNRVLSREDGNLSVSTIITSRAQDYRDIDLLFAAKPNGEIYKKRDAAAVKQAVKNLILTNYYEKPFEPFYGGNIRALLFELADSEIEDDVKDQISRAIGIYEPRALVRNIFVNWQEERNSLTVTLEFQVVNTEEVVTFTTSLSRLR